MTRSTRTGGSQTSPSLACGHFMALFVAGKWDITIRSSDGFVPLCSPPCSLSHVPETTLPSAHGQSMGLPITPPPAPQGACCPALIHQSTAWQHSLILCTAHGGVTRPIISHQSNLVEDHERPDAHRASDCATAFSSSTGIADVVIMAGEASTSQQLDRPGLNLGHLSNSHPPLVAASLGEH